MVLNRVKFDRIKDEVTRGFDILTNGDLSGGIAKLDSTKYMKPPVPVWQQLSPRA